MRQKIAAYIFGTKKKFITIASVILLPQLFSVTQLVVYIFLLRNLTIAHFTFINGSQCLADVHWISGWYILVMKPNSRLKLTVGLNPYGKEKNNLESLILNTIKHIRNGEWNMGISLEVWCFIYFNYLNIHKHKPYETICLWYSISLTPFNIRIAQKYLLKMGLSKGRYKKNLT